MRALDWGATPLGVPDKWVPQLRTLVGVMLGSKQPMFTAWGPELTLLYNDAYRGILGSKDRDHALGRPFLDVWREIRDDLAPLVERTLAGEAVHMDDITLFMDRAGLPLEAHFSFSYTPVRDDAGSVAGFFCACAETTEKVVADRRQAFRLEVEENLRGCEDAEAVIRSVAASLGVHLGADRVGYGEVTADGRSVKLHSAFVQRVAPLLGSHLLDTFGTTMVDRLRRGETASVDDVTEQAGFDPATYESIGVRAFVSVPTLRAGRLSMTLFVSRSDPHRWTPEEVSLIETMAVRINDAVERLRAEASARANENRFRALTQAIPNQVWTARPDGVLDWANDRTLAYAGTPDVGFEGRGWQDLIHPDDLPDAIERWAASLASGETYEVEFRIRRADGAYRWHLARAIPQSDASGAIVRWIGTNTDIHDQKSVELDLKDAKVAAEAANLAKSTFMANMSHELRTPLSAIIGYAEMMSEEIVDGTQAAQLAPDVTRIERSARHLLGLINDVLDLSKVESGKMEAFAESFDVAAILTDVAATVATLMEKKRNRFTLDLGDEVGAALGTMHSDVTRVRQILLNLLSNAAKFTEGGTITLTAWREPAADGDRVRFSVTDTGIGMTEEQLSRLFQRFQQADASTTRQFGGTGLGLALTKAFAALLGGEVTVTSICGGRLDLHRVSARAARGRCGGRGEGRSRRDRHRASGESRHHPRDRR